MPFRVLLIFALFVSCAAHADSFDVQIGAFRNPDVANISLPPDVGELRSISGPDGLTRFVVGPFLTRVEALEARDRLRNNGFGGAFVRASAAGRTVIRDSAYVSEPREQTVVQDTSREYVSASDGEGEVVYLDGRLHRKVGDRFVPISE